MIHPPWQYLNNIIFAHILINPKVEMMKKPLLLIASVAIVLSACNNVSTKSIKLKTPEDSLAYAFGVTNYFGLKGEDIEIDPTIMAKGMYDSKNDINLMNQDVAQTFLYLYFQKKNEMETREAYKDAIGENEKFLEENKKKEGVVTTASGLQYEIIKMGTGEKPGPENTVKVHYTGKLVSGEVFDSSVDRGEPVVFPVSGVIKGWVEGLQLMPVGSKFRLYIPSDLGYGANGAGGVIPPYSTLIFDVELLEIVS